MPKCFLCCVSAHPFSAFAWSGVFNLFSLTSWGMFWSQYTVKTGRGKLKTCQQSKEVTVLPPNLGGLWISCQHLSQTFQSFEDRYFQRVTSPICLKRRRGRVGIWILLDYLGQLTEILQTYVLFFTLWSALKAGNVFRIENSTLPMTHERRGFFGGVSQNMTLPLKTCINRPLSLCQKLSESLMQKNTRYYKRCQRYITSYLSLWSFPRLHEKLHCHSKSFLACSCKTPGVGDQVCSTEILLNSANAASLPSLLLFTIAPTPRQSYCRFHRGWGCCRCLRLEITSASSAISEINHIRHWEQWGIRPVSQT